MAYLDNNATTVMSKDVMAAMCAGCNKGNPSASYASAEGCKALMEDFAAVMRSHCGAPDHELVWTSGASEANATIVNMMVFAWRHSGRTDLPRFVLSAIEHRSLLDGIAQYVDVGLATSTLISPRADGRIWAEDLEAELRDNVTCLVCVMHANNETGAINDIEELQRVAHAHGVPFYSDAAQTYGKIKLVPVDAFCISFHKCHGPPGVGALMLRRQLIKGRGLQAMIHGTQNKGLRGGTENMPGVCGAYRATMQLVEQFDARCRHMRRIGDVLFARLRLIGLPLVPFEVYKGAPTPTHAMFVVFGGVHRLPNTLLIALVDPNRRVCNGDIKKALLAQKYIVSIGSACNTASSKASHVLYAMGADELCRRGTLRISWCYETTEDQIISFCACFARVARGLKHNP